MRGLLQQIDHKREEVEELQQLYDSRLALLANESHLWSYQKVNEYLENMAILKANIRANRRQLQDWEEYL